MGSRDEVRFSPVFEIGHVYKRTKLHEDFGGQRQGGISTPSRFPIVMLFTGDSGEPYGYSDGRLPDGRYRYTGEGQEGDMTFRAGNKAIRDHLKDNEALHLFEIKHGGYVQYVGQMVCTAFRFQEARDVHNNIRKIIVFELVRIGPQETAGA